MCKILIYGQDAYGSVMSISDGSRLPGATVTDRRNDRFISLPSLAFAVFEINRCRLIGQAY